MGSATRTTEIAAPATEVWAILTKLDAYHDWDPGYVMSEYTSDQRTGVGVTRRVELKSPMGEQNFWIPLGSDLGIGLAIRC